MQNNDFFIVDFAWHKKSMAFLCSISRQYHTKVIIMPRKGENNYKRKDGRWEGRFISSYDAGNKAKYACVYGKTYSEVKQKLINKRSIIGKTLLHETR